LVSASDPGIGVNSWQLSTTGWSEKLGTECAGVQCDEQRSYATYDPYNRLPDGEDAIELKASDALGLSATTTAKVKVTASATDGTKPSVSSGVASIGLAVDGKEIGKPGGHCSPGPCTASSEWTISGTEFGVGPNTITITAADNAGNVAKTELPLFVARPTTPVPVGPGPVNPQSGELNLSATDVSVAAPGSSLTVGRSYGSLHLQAGAEGPLGPQWSLNLGGSQSLSKLPNGNVLLIAGAGTGLEREGVSEALVFSSAQGAKDQLVTSVAEALKEYEKVSLRRFVDPGIPGSAGLGNFTPGKRGATGNVFFSTGRCFFVVGDLVRDARTSAQGAKAPIAGATALYKRVKHACA
jgi:Domain of unknown function (DUF6531)